MLPENYGPNTPLTFVYWEKKNKKNMGITYQNPLGIYALVRANTKPEPFVFIIGLN